VGVDEGDEVSPFYDPMLAKVIAWGESRDEAGARLRGALADLEISGVRTNRALLASVLGDAEFRRGEFDTGFIERRRAALRFEEPAAGDDDLVLGALWLASRATSAALWQDTGGWRLGGAALTQWRFGDRTVNLERQSAHRYRAHAAAGAVDVFLLERLERGMRAEMAGKLCAVTVVEDGPLLHLYRGGEAVELGVARTEDTLRASAQADDGSLLTPLPGTVVAVHVKLGERVARGAPLITVEAMKMEHTLIAPHDGVVERIPFGLAERVAAGAVLIGLSSA